MTNQRRASKGAEVCVVSVFAWAALTVCGGAAAADDPLIVAREYALSAPAVIPSGFNTFRFENRGREPHYVRFLRLPPNRDPGEIDAWRRSPGPLPDWLVPSGGIGTLAPGESTRFTMRLEPGQYLLICTHPTPDGVPHVVKGMSTMLKVEAAASGSREPVADRELVLSDGQMQLTAVPAAGITTTWHVVNRGPTRHQALLVQLQEGVTASRELDWFRGGSQGVRPGHPVGGVLELAPGADVWFETTLPAGRYVLFCSIPRADGTRDFDAGMVYEFRVS